MEDNDGSLLNQASFDKVYGLRKANKQRFSAKFRNRARASLTSEGLVTAIRNFLPCIDVMRTYKFRSQLLQDVVSGLTVCAMNIPQGLAYSMLAGLPPVHGLYTSLFPVLAYFFFGTSRHNSVGVMAVIAIAMNSGVTRLMQDFPLVSAGSIVNYHATDSSAKNSTVITTTGPPNSGSDEQIYEFNGRQLSASELRLELTMVMTLMSGIILLIASFLRLGFLTNYLSEAMLNGYTTGLSTHVATAQLFHLLGYGPSRRFSSILKLPYIYVDLFASFAKMNLTLLPLSLLCIVTIDVVKERVQPLISKHVNFQLPIDLLMIIAGTALGRLVSLPSYKIRIVGHVPAGMPTPKVPDFGMLSLCISDSFIVAAIGYAQSIALAKTFAQRFGYQVRSNQELVALGLANVISSCFSSFSCAAAVSRSMVQVGAGCQSQLSGLVNCIGIVLILLWVAPLFETLPTFVLAGIVLVALKSAINQFKALPTLFHTSKWDFSMWLVAFVATVLMDADYGLIVGFAYAVLTILLRVQAPHCRLLGQLSGTDEYRDVERYHAAHELQGVKIIRFEGPLIFANVDSFRKSLFSKTAAAQRVTVRRSSVPVTQGEAHEQDAVLIENVGVVVVEYVVVDCGAIGFTDPAGSRALQSIITEFCKKKVKVLLAAPNNAVCEVLERSGFFKKHSNSLVFPSVRSTITHIERERERDQALVNIDSTTTTTI